MGAPAGPVGCHAPEAMPRWEVAAGWSGFSTDLAFSDGREPTLAQHGASLSLTRILREGWSVQATAGVILGGVLEDAGTRWDVAPGWLASVHGARQWRGAAGAIPFVATSLALSASGTRTRSAGDEASLVATDVRLAVVVGWDVAGRWFPYLAARAFGGPVLWNPGGDRVSGSDKHHYNAALGSRIRLGGGVSLFADASVLGERSIGAGAAVSW